MAAAGLVGERAAGAASAKDGGPGGAGERTAEAAMATTASVVKPRAAVRCSIGPNQSFRPAGPPFGSTAGAMNRTDDPLPNSD